MNPFDTPSGRQAQLAEYRLLAAGEGPVADFAKEVVAGRADPRDLLTVGWVVEDWIDQFEDMEPAAESAADAEFTAEEAEAFLERHLAGVASLDVDAIEAELMAALMAARPRPPVEAAPDEDDEGDGPPLLKDAW
ncbi:hypothetical protein ACWGE0_11310 [Lentzea sp. NPDC054927]